METSELNLKLANEVLAKVRSAGFDHAEVIVSEKAETEMQIDAGDISLLRNTENVELKMRAIAGGRYAAISLNQLDDDSIASGIAKLKEAAKAAPVDEARAFAPKREAPVVSEGPVEASLESMYSRVNALVENVAKSYPELVVEQSTLKFQRGRTVRANSLGLELDESAGFYSMMAMFSSKRGDKTSSFNYSGAVSRDLSKDLINWGSIERLFASSVKEVEHTPFEGKFVGPAILTPDVVYDMMGTWFSHIEDSRLIAGTSQLRGKIGEQVASPLFTIRSEPQSQEFAWREYTTGDGYPSHPSTLVEKGVLKTYALSDYGARKTGLPRSVNGFHNRVIDAGDSSLEEMVKATKRGVLLARFSGGMPSANGDFSGVVKNSFLIEDGQVTRPVSEITISGNAFQLMKSITAISKERVNDGGRLTPWIAVNGLTFAGG